MFNSEKWPHAAQLALQTASTIQVSGAVASDMPFFQGLLARAQAGASVEWLLDRQHVPQQTGLNTAYFERLAQAGAALFYAPEQTGANLLPFILLDGHTLLLPPHETSSLAQIETQVDKVAPYQALYQRQKVKSALSASLAAPRPLEIRFEANPAYVDIHQRFELSWDVRGAERVRIEPLLGAVLPKGSRVLSAEQTVEFRLTAEHTAQSLTRAIQVTVNPAPRIEYVLAVAGERSGQETPLRPHAAHLHRYGLVRGQAVRLYWRCYNADQVLLDGQPVPPSGNMVLMPATAGAYTLVAQGKAGTAQQTLLIDVFQRPEIEHVPLPPAPLFTFEAPPFGEKMAAFAPPPTVPPTEEPPIRSLRDFLWLCSGVSRQVLATCPPSEHAKYAGIGGAVFFTGLLAALSGGYALYTAFQNAPAAIFFGLLWGTVIFNLDRLIVSTLKKEGNVARQWRQALPRIALAAVLSVVIAKPLELRIFEPEVLEILAARKAEKMHQTEAFFREKTAETDRRIAVLKAETEAGYEAREALYQAYRCECDGTCGTGRVGRGTECERKEAKYRQADQEYQTLKTENDKLIGGVRAEVVALKKEEAAALRHVATIHAQGFVARLSAAQKLPFWPGFFIALLILMVEIAPVLSKILTPAGPYDEAVRTAEAHFTGQQSATLQQAETLRQQQANLQARLHQVAADQAVERQEAILRLVAEAQVEMAREAVEKWAEGQRKQG